MIEGEKAINIIISSCSCTLLNVLIAMLAGNGAINITKRECVKEKERNKHLDI